MSAPSPSSSPQQEDRTLPLRPWAAKPCQHQHPPIPAAHQLLLPSGSEWPAHGARTTQPVSKALHAVHLHQWTLGYPAMHLPRSSFSSARSRVQPGGRALPAARLPLVPHVIQPKPEITAGGSGPAAPRPSRALILPTWPWLPRRKDPSKLGRGGPWVPCRWAGRAPDVTKLFRKEAHEGRLPSKTKKGVCLWPLHQILQPLLIHEPDAHDERPYMRHLPQSLPEARPPTRPCRCRYHGGGCAEEGCSEESLSVCS